MKMSGTQTITQLLGGLNVADGSGSAVSNLTADELRKQNEASIAQNDFLLSSVNEASTPEDWKPNGTKTPSFQSLFTLISGTLRMNSMRIC